MKESRYSHYVNGSSALDLSYFQDEDIARPGFAYIPGSLEASESASVLSAREWLRESRFIVSQSLGISEMLSLATVRSASPWESHMPAWAACGAVALLAVLSIVVALI